MAFFQPRLQQVKVTFSPFSTQNMLDIGQVVLDHIRDRIHSVQDVRDAPAKPLTEKYADAKRKGRYVTLGGPRKYSGLPYRDWTLRGRTLGSCRVKFASQDRATIGPTSEESGRIMTIRNKVDKMWGLSPSDAEALVAATLRTLQTHQIVRAQHQKVA